MGGFVVAFAVFGRLFDWRNCGVTRSGPTLDGVFVPPDAWFWYDAERLRNLFERIEPQGRSHYALTQLTLDVLFPALYVAALVLIVRGLFPEKHRLRLPASCVAVAAGLSDVAENIVLAGIAWRGHYGEALGRTASLFTAGKWLLLLLAGLLLGFGFLSLHTKRAKELVQRLIFIRIPLLLGGLLFGISVLGRRQECTAAAANPVGIPTVQNLLAVDNGVQLEFAAYFAFIASAVIVFTGRLLWRLAPIRLGVEEAKPDLPPVAQAPNAVETWAQFGILTIALALPLLTRIGIDDGESLPWDYAFGFGGAVLTVLLVRSLRDLLRGNLGKDYTDWALNPLRARAAWVELILSAGLARLFGPGFSYPVAKPLAQGELRLIPGHALAAAVALSLFIGYVLIGALLNPIGALPSSLDVPPIGYVMLLIAFVCMLLSVLTFLLDRVRVPLVLALATWFFLWGSLSADSVWYDAQHYFDVTFVAEGPEAPPSVEEAFKARTARQGAKGPIIVIAAAGGGIQAAAWAAVVLQRLDEALGPDFADSIYLVSATSGGSVGAYFFIEALRAKAKKAPPELMLARLPDFARKAARQEYVGFTSSFAFAAKDMSNNYLKHVPKAAMASSLEATAWGLVFPDLQRLVTPFLVDKDPSVTARDRAWAMEQAWHRWRSCMVSDSTARFVDLEKNPDCRQPLSESPPPTRLSDWWALARGGVLPGVILNGTVIENGEQFLASSLNLEALNVHPLPFARPDGWTAGAFDPTLSGHYPSGAPRYVDMRAVTAARLSATFPYVTPVARARVRRDDTEYRGGEVHETDGAKLPAWHVGDGGYFDNPGTLAALRWIKAIQRIDEERKVLFIQINPFPAASEREAPKNGQGWRAALLGPLTGIINVRTSSQLARSDLELSLLESSLGDCFEAVEFRPPYEKKRAEPPLSWELSRADRKRLGKDWDTEQNASTVAHLKKNYFGEDSAWECARAAERPAKADSPPD